MRHAAATGHIAAAPDYLLKLGVSAGGDPLAGRETGIVNYDAAQAPPKETLARFQSVSAGTLGLA